MSGFNPALNMYGLYPNIYNNQVALNDLTNLDLYSPIGAVPNPMMSMNGSIFGTAPCMPYMPSFGGSANYEDYYKNYEKYQDFMINNQVRQQQKMRNADLRLNSPQEGIAKQAAILREKIMQSEQQQILEAYNSYVESVRSMYGDGSPEEIANRASTLYAQQFGTTIIDDIRKFGNDSFTQGLLQSVTFGCADKNTAEENISQLTGQPVGRTEKAKKLAGNVFGGVLVGSAAGLAAKLIGLNKIPLIKTLTKIPVLAIAGGIIGGILGSSASSSTK